MKKHLEVCAICGLLDRGLRTVQTPLLSLHHIKVFPGQKIHRWHTVDTTDLGVFPTRWIPAFAIQLILSNPEA